MYELKPAKNGPHWGFGSGERPPLTKSRANEPSPFAYDIKPHFADVPKYLMNNSRK